MNSSFLLISAALLTWGIGEGMFLLFVPLHLEELGADPLLIGSIFSVFGFVMMISHIPAGYLSDRLGRRPLLVAAWVLGAISAWTMALANSLPIFVIGYLLYGLTAFVSSPLFSYVTAARGKLTTSRAMTLASATFNFGAVIGPIIGGAVGGRFGLKVTFTISAAIFLVSVMLIFLLKPQPRDLHDELEGPRESLFANKKFVTFLGIAFLGTFAMFMHQPLTPNFLQNERGITISQMGWIGSIGSLGNVVFNLLLGHFNPRLGYLMGQGSVAISTLAFWQGNLPGWYAFGYFIMGGYRVSRQLIFAQVRAVTHPAQMGMAYGLTEAFNSFAAILAPLLAGFLYDRNPAQIYPIGFFMIVFAMMVSFIFIPHTVQQEGTPAPVEQIP